MALTPSPKGTLLFKDPAQLHPGLNITVRAGTKYLNMEVGCTRIGASAEPNRTHGHVDVLGTMVYEGIWDIPISLMRLNHNFRARGADGLCRAMQVAYGPTWQEEAQLTVILFTTPDMDSCLTLDEDSLLNRQQVYKSIDTERRYRQLKWEPLQNEEDHIPTVGDYTTYMRSYLTDAQRFLTHLTTTEGALGEIRKVVSLGVACLEVHGCPDRSAEDFDALDN